MGCPGRVVVWAALGAVAGNTALGIAICIAIGAVGAGVWHYAETRKIDS
jgi:hypothetical protein